MNLDKIKKDMPQELREVLNRQSFKELPHWHGGINKTKYIFELGKQIYLGINYAGNPILAPAREKEFYRGLWEYDLVEAFISLENDKYIEINLAINGSWWAASFSDYRIEEKEAPFIKLESVYSKSKDNKNFVLACFGYENLKFTGEFNITAIIDKQHYSLNTPPKEIKPDFHLKELRK